MQVPIRLRYCSPFGPRLAALALLFTACAPDATTAPRLPNDISGPNAARSSGVVTTVIIAPDLSPGAGTVYGNATAINEAGVVAGWRRSPIAGPSAYTWKDGVFTDLGVSFQPEAINRSGDIAGNTLGPSQGVLWKDGQLIPLGGPAGSFVTVTDMNDKGQIVGYTRLAGGTATRAFIWENGAMTDLGTLGGAMAAAMAINKHGQVVGCSTTAAGTMHAVLWERGAMTDLGAGHSGPSGAYGINGLGEIVGLLHDLPPGGFTRPFIWRKGVITPVTFAGAGTATTYRIEDFTDGGHIVASLILTGGDYQPYVWHDGVTTGLGVPGVCCTQFAMAGNSSGEIVGYASPSVASPGAFLWSVGRKGP